MANGDGPRENGLTCAGSSEFQWQDYLHSWFAFWSKLLAFGAYADGGQQLLHCITRVTHEEVLAETRYRGSVEAQNYNQVSILTLVTKESESSSSQCL